MYKLTVNLPGSPKGVLVHVDYLGEFKNGVPSDVSDEDAERFKIITGETVLKKLQGNPLYEVEVVKDAPKPAENKTGGGEK